MAVHPTKNIQIDSNYTTLKIGENSYDSNFYKGACVYMPNYYYSSFIEDVYLGTEAQLAMTFLVAEADLRGSKIVTLRDMSIPFDGISFTTDSFVFCDSIEEIGSYADPVAYEEEREKKQPADYSLENKVRNSINGYYVTFYQTLGTMIVEYELEFAEPNYFELRSDMLSNSGTYDVCKGYIVLNYITGGDPLYIAYDFDSGDIALYCSDAFSVYQ